MTKRFALALLAVMLAASPIAIFPANAETRKYSDELRAQLELEFMNRIPRKVTGIETDPIPFTAVVESIRVTFDHPMENARGRLKPLNVDLLRHVEWTTSPVYYAESSGRLKFKRLAEGTTTTVFTPVYAAGGRGQVFTVKEGDKLRIPKVRLRVKPRNIEGDEPASLRIELQGVKLPTDLPYPPPELAFFRVTNIRPGGFPAYISMDVVSDVGYPEPVSASARWYDAYNRSVDGGFGKFIPTPRTPFRANVGLSRPSGERAIVGAEVFVMGETFVEGKGYKTYARVVLPCADFEEALRGCN